MMTPDQIVSLAGKTALVTGAGRGIGRAVCDMFARAGARIAALDIDGDAAAASVAHLPDAIALACDISDEAAVEATFAKLADRGGIDVLVHAAAVFPKHRFTTLRAADWDAIHAVNTRGSFLVLRECVKAMTAQGRGGAIVNVSSASGERALVHHNSTYGASKAALTNLTRSLAVEIAGDGIRINAVLPGGVMTEGAAEATARMRADGLQTTGAITGEGRVPLGRMGQPEDIAAACLFFAGAGAACITGQTLAVDGGFLVS